MKPKGARRGTNLTKIDNPDDAEQLKQRRNKGDSDSLMGIDNPDDAELNQLNQRKKREQGS